MQDLHCTGSQKLEALHFGVWNIQQETPLKFPTVLTELTSFYLTGKASQTPQFQLQTTAGKQNSHILCTSDEKDWKFSMSEWNKPDFNDRTPAQEYYILDSFAEAPQYSQNSKPESW